MCGIFGVYSADESAAKLSYFGLFALQHRGQEAAGLACTPPWAIHGDGLVMSNFGPDDMKCLKGNIVIGHVRYSTSSNDDPANHQPLVNNGWVVAHNGNLVDYEGELSDSNYIAELLGTQGLQSTLRSLHDKGSYSLVMAYRDKLYGARDAYGLRPLCIGWNGKTFALSSESCAFDTIGFEFVREVYPGELVLIDERGLTSTWWKRPADLPYPKPCIFEKLYLANPLSILDGRSVYDFRLGLGRKLGIQDNIEADMVMGVPDSGITAAIGYAEVTNIPYEQGIIKNRYIARTFIEPTQSMRELGVKLKLSAIKDVIYDKDIVVIDDSIVRANTSKQLIKMLREAGANKIHFRVACPEITNPCYYGVDMKTKDELISARMSVEEVRQFIGADTLQFLSIADLTNGMPEAYCTACFTGNYPIPKKVLDTPCSASYN